MSIGNTNKKKGSNAERFYAKIFRELGYEHCVTSRYGSRIHDDAGIDLINLPINVQIKAGKQVGLNPVQVLSKIKETIKTKFYKDSPEITNPLVLIHRREARQGVKRNEFDDIVFLTFEDFIKIFRNKY